MFPNKSDLWERARGTIEAAYKRTYTVTESKHAFSARLIAEHGNFSQETPPTTTASRHAEVHTDAIAGKAITSTANHEVQARSAEEQRLAEIRQSVSEAQEGGYELAT